ncbi:MAG: 50S ribosomal protein L11 methyltransferase [Candidatus Neomarinimicrobiota bacterium]
MSRSWLPVPEQDWHLNWRKHFIPIQVTKNITIVPEWDTRSRAPILIRLRPGMVFGTGHHATTRLVLTMLDHLGCGRQRVLDMGTGSGVLAIAAALLGAQRVTAVELDPDCKENFLTNLALNALTGRVDFVQGDAGGWEDFNFDLVLANINRAVIFPLPTRYARSDSPGKAVVSGLSADDKSVLLSHCCQLDLALAEVEVGGEWLCAVLMRARRRTP